MRDMDSAPILERLLEVTVASRDAFAKAACAVRSPGYAALFVERVEDHARIATYLTEQLASGIPSATTPHHNVNVASGSEAYGVRDPFDILGECLRVLDVAILEFSRAYGPSITLAQRIQLARHQNQMEWAREELFDLRADCSTPRVARPRLNLAEPFGPTEAPSLAAAGRSNRQHASFPNGIAHAGLAAPTPQEQEGDA